MNVSSKHKLCSRYMQIQRLFYEEGHLEVNIARLKKIDGATAGYGNPTLDTYQLMWNTLLAFGHCRIMV